MITHQTVMRKYLRATSLIRVCLFLLTLTLALPLTALAESGVQPYGAVHQAWIDPSPSNPGIEYGNAIAMHGDTLVVGAQHDNATIGIDTIYYVGAVYVYVLEENTWVLQARLSPNDPESGDLFGSSVDISGDTLVVGAVGSDGTDDTGEYAPEMGAVYVFTRSGETWTQQAKIEPLDGLEDDNFGNAVSLIGERVVVGASSKDIGTTSNAGKVYSYYRNGSKWYAAQSITAPKIEKNATFGSSIDYDGARVVVGAQAEKDVGAAYVFYRTGSKWTLESTLDADDDQQGDNFGASVAIDGETIVVGAPFADPNLGFGDITNAGAAYIYRKAAGGWRQETKLVAENAATFSHFGRFVSTNNNRVVVGATGYSIGNILRAGSAYVYDRNGGEWPLQTQIFSADPYIDAGFGASITFDDEIIFIGEPGSDTVNRAGRVHIYALREGVLPETGFAPNSMTELSQPPASVDTSLGDLQISIPEISLQTEIVSIQRRANTWGVDWLTTSVGHLDGTAYPTHVGNTVLAGHVNLPDGSNGPFAAVDQLQWGDEIILRLDGVNYIYEIRSIYTTDPHNLDILEKNDGYDWLTLITCAEFDETSGIFRQRVVVETVLVDQR
jgi:LPXTG-site transpeptidase (sortase) family protein